MEKEWDFDFVVSGLSEEDAKALLDLFVGYVDLCRGQVAGGFVEHKEEADDEAS